MKFSLLTFCIFFFGVASANICVDDDNENFEFTPFPYSIHVSTLQGRGIGYNKGYSTLGLLYNPTWDCTGTWNTFFDFRAHVFNDYLPASNLGIGLRYMDHNHKFVYGANLYYDYRKAHHRNFQQIGIGAELLGNCFDVRVNGYIPVAIYHANFGETCFTFPGNFFAHCKKQQKAMSGVDLEVGRFFLGTCGPCDFLELYAAAGTYYFSPRMHSNCSKNTWGGKFRLRALFWDCLEFEGRTTLDRVFHWRGEGVITLRFLLGERYCRETCYNDNMLAIASQPVERQEIIVLDKPCCVWKTNFGGFSRSCD